MKWTLFANDALTALCRNGKRVLVLNERLQREAVRQTQEEWLHTNALLLAQIAPAPEWKRIHSLIKNAVKEKVGK